MKMVSWLVVGSSESCLSWYWWGSVAGLLLGNLVPGYLGPLLTINNGGFHYPMRPADVAKRRREDESEDDGEEGGDGEGEARAGAAATPRTAPQRRQCVRHKWARPCKRGMCGIKGCGDEHAIYGCATCGYRLCSMECMYQHEHGNVAHISLNKKVEWEPWWDGSEWVDPST